MRHVTTRLDFLHETFFSFSRELILGDLACFADDKIYGCVLILAEKNDDVLINGGETGKYWKNSIKVLSLLERSKTVSALPNYGHHLLHKA